MAYILLFLLANTAVSFSNAGDVCSIMMSSGTMSSGSYTVEWEIDEEDYYVEFTYSAETTNWVGLGFSLSASMVCKSTKYNYTNLIIVLIIIFVLTIDKL